MSEQNTNTQANEVREQISEATVKMFATREEALAAKPADAAKSLKPFEVSKAGAAVGWVLGRGYDHALSIVARIDGYTVSLGNSAPVTKEAVAAKLATFSDEELKALGLSRKPQKGSKN